MTVEQAVSLHNK